MKYTNDETSAREKKMRDKNPFMNMLKLLYFNRFKSNLYALNITQPKGIEQHSTTNEEKSKEISVTCLKNKA